MAIEVISQGPGPCFHECICGGCYSKLRYTWPDVQKKDWGDQRDGGTSYFITCPACRSNVGVPKPPLQFQ